MLEAWWVPLSEVIRNFGLLVAAAVGAVLGGLRVVAANRQADAALRQAEPARWEHVAELFNRAVGQLADEKLHVRLGAVYTLRQIAEDFPDLTRAVSELLAAHVRELPSSHGDLPPPEVREIMRILRERLRDER